jgi:mannose-1-phosphate guanylyltransferase
MRTKDGRTRRVAIIMAGGSGERFWPLSRPHRPKQLLRLTSPDQTMLEEAVRRIEPLVGEGEVYVATGLGLRAAICEAGIVAADKVLAEPARRNTLGCLAWTAATLLARHGDEPVTMAILTADHKIGEPERFRETVRRALEAAEERGCIATIGVRPTRPETGYGYIEYEDSPGETVHRSRRFREKPNREQAQEFLKAGSFLWNSGMFFWTLETFLDELGRADPATVDKVRAMADALRAGDEQRAARAFETLPNLSIDYALLEKARNVCVVPAEFPWDDVGAWDSLERTLPLDSAGNVIQGDALLLDTSGCVVYNESPGVKVCVLGCEDLVVVATGDAVLVVPKGRAQEVKRLVAELEGSD